jgi:hypothetical protein
MKRIFQLFAIVVLCTLSTSFTASAQFDLGKALGQLMGSTEPTSTMPSPYDTLRDNAPQRSKLLGTWQYKAASLEYLGDNPLAEVALAQIEVMGTSELAKYGIVEGCCTITIRRNGMAVLATRDAIQDCYIDYNEENAEMEVSTTVDGVTYRAKGYVRMTTQYLTLLFHAQDILKIIEQATPEVTYDQMYLAAKEVVKSFKDGYLAIILTR